MNVVIRAKAAEDLTGIFAWIARDNPSAAVDVAQRTRRRIGRLATPGLAPMGRPGRVAGTRELVESPYIIVYEVHDHRDEIVVLGIFHGAQSR